jgi:integrase/recombinase XerD
VSDLAEGLNEYLSTLVVDRGLANNTVLAYRRDLEDYISFLKGIEPQPADVDRYAGVLAERSLAPATIARKLAAVRGLHRFLVTEGRSDADPTRLLPAMRRADPFPKALAVHQAIALVEAPDLSTVAGRRDRALLEFLYGTGARVSEAVDLALPDLDLVERTVILTGKGGRQRQVPLGGAAVTAITNWLPDRSDLAARVTRPDAVDRDAVFLNLRGRRLSRQSAFRMVRFHAARVGIDPAAVSPHTLRHSAATHMVEAGADLRSVQVLLGHAKISTTQVYTRVSPQHLVEIFFESHPRSR